MDFFLICFVFSKWIYSNDYKSLVSLKRFVFGICVWLIGSNIWFVYGWLGSGWVFDWFSVNSLRIEFIIFKKI